MIYTALIELSRFTSRRIKISWMQNVIIEFQRDLNYT